MRDKFDVAFANDTDADRHGIVTRIERADESEPFPGRRDLLSVREPPALGQRRAVGKTIVSARSSTASRRSSAASWSRRRSASNGSSMGWRRLVWLRRRGKRRRLVPAARRHRCGPPTRTASSWDCWRQRCTARTGRDPSQLFDELTAELGVPFYERIDAPATPNKRALLKALVAGATRHEGTCRRAGPRSADRRRPATASRSAASRSIADNGWFAARPSGTEDVYKIYAESFRGEDHLKRIQSDAQAAIAKVFG